MEYVIGRRAVTQARQDGDGWGTQHGPFGI